MNKTNDNLDFNNTISEDLQKKLDSNEILNDNEIDALLSAIDYGEKDNKNKPSKMKPFDLTLDFKYKNVISKSDLYYLTGLISKVMENYGKKISETKGFKDLSVTLISHSMIKPSEIENYFNFDEFTNMDKIDTEPIIKNYLLNDSPMYLAASTGLINLIIDRKLNQTKDKVAEYSAELYLFSLFESYFNQLSSKKLISHTDKNPDLYKENKKEELYLLIEIGFIFNEELIPLSIVMPKETYTQFCTEPETEVTIRSKDYYKKRGALAVVSGTQLEEAVINSIKEGTNITFPIKENKYVDLVINNTLKGKGICGTYMNGNLNVRLDIKEIVEGKTNNNYFTSDNNVFLIYATADSKKTLQQLKNYTPDANTHIILDTEIHISTLLLIANSKIIGTVEVTEKDNNLQATVRKLLSNPIDII